MPQVTIKIGQSDSFQYDLTDDKVKYMLKFADSISDDSEQETGLISQIETSLRQVKKMKSGELPKRTLKQMLDNK